MSKTFKDRISVITSHLLSKERFADMLSNLGIEVNRDHKFSMREEKTKSVAIYNTGSAFDFGEGGGRIDIVDVIMHKDNLSFKDAVEKAEDMLGIDNEGNASYQFKAPIYIKKEGSVGDGDYDETPLKESYVRYFRECLWKNRAKADKHLLKLMPSTKPEQRQEMIDKFEMGYDPKTDKITIPVRSVKGHIMNLAKYTSEPGKDDNGKDIPKLKYLYGRRRVLFNLKVLKSAPKVLLILEGEKDVVNASINNTSAITQGAASGWKNWMAESIKKSCEYYGVPIPKLIILQDNDKPGIISTLRIFNALKKIQPKTKMMFWEKKTIDNLLQIEKVKPHKKSMVICKTNYEESCIPKGFDYTDLKTIPA